MSEQPNALELADKLSKRTIPYIHQFAPGWPVQSGYQPDEECGQAATELRRQHAEIEALRSALNALYITAPTSLECQHFHHGRLERHASGAECGPREKYLEALRGASEALKGAAK